MSVNENNLSQEDIKGIEEAMLHQGVFSDEIDKIYKDFQAKIKLSKDILNTAQNNIFFVENQYPSIKIATKPITIIIKRTENTLEAIDLMLEYQINGQEEVIIKATGKLAGSIAFYIGATVSGSLAKATAALVARIYPPAAHFAAFFVFETGVIISNYIAEKFESYVIEYLKTSNKFVCPEVIQFGDKFYNNNKSQEEIYQELFNVYSLALPTYPQKQIASVKLASNEYLRSDIYARLERDAFKELSLKQEYYESDYKKELEKYKKEFKEKIKFINILFENLNDMLIPHLFTFSQRGQKPRLNQSFALMSKRKYALKMLSEEELENVDLNSSFAHKRALFLCQNIIVVDENNEPVLNEKNAHTYLGYKDEAYIALIRQKDILTQDYFLARKALYKSLMLIKEEMLNSNNLNNAIKLQTNKAFDKLNALIDKKLNINNSVKNQVSVYAQKLQAKTNEFIDEVVIENEPSKKIQDKYLILKSKDKTRQIIFLDSKASLTLKDKSAFAMPSMSNLIHLYDDKRDIFAQNNTNLDSKQIEQDFKVNLSEIPANVFFYSLLLRGGEEDENNAGFFYGENDEVYITLSDDNVKIIYGDYVMQMSNYYYHAY